MMDALTFEIQPLAKVLRKQDLGAGAGLAAQIYELLRRRIIDLSLPPEMPLAEQDVANLLQASKTPVREAIIRLSREGLVAVVPKSGSYVTPINIERYLQACFVRVQLEVGCVRRLTSLPLGLEDVTRLRAVLAEQKKALQDKDDARFFALDEKFHHSLFQMAGLPSVWETLNASKAELDRVRHLKRLFGVRRSAHVIREHGEIIDAIAARNPELAEKTLLAHIGGIDDEIARMSEHPHLIKSIDDLNRLVALNRKTRNKRKLA